MRREVPAHACALATLATRGHAATLATLALLALSTHAGCAPRVDIGADARLRCAGDSDCPRDTRCIDDDDDGFGLCLGESPCLTQGSLAVVADGTACGDEGELCVDGACGAPFCGDGIVTFRAGELCDPRRDARCRADCTPSVCGDGIIDGETGETCDVIDEGCVDCAVMCLGVVQGPPLSFVEAQSDCNLEPDDGCECAPRRFAIERDRLVQQAALVGDTLYLVTADLALAEQGQLSFRLERATLDATSGTAGALEALERTTLLDDVGFLDLAHAPGDPDAFYAVSVSGRNEVHRLGNDGSDVIVHAATANENATGRLAADDEHVYGASLGGVRKFARDGDGSFGDDVLFLSDTCRDGATGKLVSCGPVIACFGQLDGNIVTLDKVTGEETLVDHVDVVPSPLGGAANPQTLFCKDDRLHWHDRAAVFALDDDGARRLVAQLPSLVRTAAAIESATAFGDDILLSGVTQGSFQSVLVRVDVQRRASTVVLPAGYLTHDATTIIGSANAQGELLVLDVEGTR